MKRGKRHAGCCHGLGFLGIKLDQKRNAKNAPLISTDAGHVKVRVIRTNEELMIARSVGHILGFDNPGRVSPHRKRPAKS
jgi:acetate kinase